MSIMAKKPVSVLTYNGDLRTIILLDPLITPSCEVTWHINQIFFFSICTRSMRTRKHGKLKTYSQGIPPIEPQNPLPMWSRKVTWQIKNISPPPQCIWPSKLVGEWFPMRGCTHKVIWPVNHVALWYHGTN